MDVTRGEVPDRATHQKQKINKVGEVTSVDRLIPTVDVTEIKNQAMSLKTSAPKNTPELQEILDVLNIIRHKGKKGKFLIKLSYI